MDRFGDVVYNLYGSTEVAYAAIATPDDLRAAPGTVGRPPLGSVVAIYDEDGHRLGPGQTGRIFVGSTIAFEGYTGGGNKDVIDGLLSTGDLGHLDDAGRLFVAGPRRRHDRQRRRERVPGRDRGPARPITPRSARPRSSASTTPTSARGCGPSSCDQGRRATSAPTTSVMHVKQNLARYKVPRDVVFVDALPRNPAGKVLKRELPTD